MIGEKILVVDDNLDNLKLTRILLERAGFQVQTAEGADQALAALQTDRPALILMDIQLPGMDGLDLTRLLRKDAALEDVVIIAFSAASLKGDEQIALAAGCNGYLIKPLNTRTFATTVQEYLSARLAASPIDSMRATSARRSPAPATQR